MIKFYKEDIKYVRRTGWNDRHQYHFSVTGETSNYLLNKYGLAFSNMELHFLDVDYITVTTEKDDFLSDVADIDSEDFNELMGILQEFIDKDQSNWEEYLCDDWYRKDSRWK